MPNSFPNLCSSLFFSFLFFCKRREVRREGAQLPTHFGPRPSRPHQLHNPSYPDPLHSIPISPSRSYTPPLNARIVPGRLARSPSSFFDLPAPPTSSSRSPSSSRSTPHAGARVGLSFPCDLHCASAVDALARILVASPPWRPRRRPDLPCTISILIALGSHLLPRPGCCRELKPRSRSAATSTSWLYSGPASPLSRLPSLLLLQCAATASSPSLISRQ